MSDNWVVQNLENALETWNEKLSEIWTLITTTPQNFKGGNIWKVIVDINGAVQAISRTWKQDTDLSRWEARLYRLQTNSLRTRNFIN